MSKTQLPGATLRDFDLIRGHTYLRRCVTENGIVIDAGAHRLEFSNAITKSNRCKSIALEPNAELLRGLHIDANIEFIPAALDSQNGSALLSISDNPEASSICKTTGSFAKTVQALSLESVISRVNENQPIDLLKLDIEGAEFDILANTNSSILRRIKQISVEFHDFMLDKPAVSDVVKRLQNVGFHAIRCSIRSNGDYLFLNKQHVKLGRVRLAFFRVILPIYRKTLEFRSQSRPQGISPGGGK